MRGCYSEKHADQRGGYWRAQPIKKLGPYDTIRTCGACGTYLADGEFHFYPARHAEG